MEKNKCKNSKSLPWQMNRLLLFVMSHDFEHKINVQNLSHFQREPYQIV